MDLLIIAALGVLGVAVGQSAFTAGVSLTSAANTGLIFATAPVWGMLLGLALGLERPTLRGVAGVALSIAGVAVVFCQGLGAEGASLTGDVLVLVAAGLRRLHGALHGGAGAPLPPDGFGLLAALRRARGLGALDPPTPCRWRGGVWGSRRGRRWPSPPPSPPTPSRPGRGA
jgi:drug/metabolite transporter (DMT)-like permease